MPAPALNAEEISALLHEIFPQTVYAGGGLTIERVAYGDVRVRREFHPRQLRPGGTISGPTMMQLADFTMYVAVFSAVGRRPDAVTTNLNITFLRKPGPAALIADGRLLRVGKRSVFGEVTIYSEGEEAPVAHVTSSYSIPDDR